MTYASSIAAWFPSSPSPNQLLYSIVLAVPLAFLFRYYLGPSTSTPANEDDEPYRQQKTPASSVMAAQHAESVQSPAAQLIAPKFDLYTQAELANFSGSDGGKIYVAIKGTIFDVSAKKDQYGPGGSYHVFAGKDASKALGLSSMRPEDAVPDWSGLSGSELTTLDGWYTFFQKRYSIVGTVSDLPEAVSRFK